MQALEDDDDYVASLLKRDAQNALKRHASGLSSSAKRPPDAPRTNLRFLKNVLRDVGTHNADLKAKEEESSQTRARELRAKEQERSKRRKRDDEPSSSNSKRRRGDHEREGRWKSALTGLGTTSKVARDKVNRPGQRHSSRRSTLDGSDSEGREEDRRYRRMKERPRTRSRSPVSSERRVGRRSRDRSRSRSQERGRRRKPQHRERSDDATSTFASEHTRYRASKTWVGNDSDGAEPVIGPKPPPPQGSFRGRGRTGGDSSTDARFHPDYDPRTDVTLDDEEEDDWDMALEAIRDRAKWNASGADRLRAAGFTEQEVTRWKTGGERGIEDVRWRKKGEAREWDQGKVLDDRGEVTLKPEWG